MHQRDRGGASVHVTTPEARLGAQPSLATGSHILPLHLRHHLDLVASRKMISLRESLMVSEFSPAKQFETSSERTKHVRVVLQRLAVFTLKTFAEEQTSD